MCNYLKNWFLCISIMILTSPTQLTIAMEDNEDTPLEIFISHSKKKEESSTEYYENKKTDDLHTLRKPQNLHPEAIKDSDSKQLFYTSRLFCIIH